MSLFSFLFGKNRKRSASRRRTAEAAADSGNGTQAPPPAYVFAHRLLPAISLSNPEGLLALSADPTAIRGLLHSMLHDVESYCLCEAPFSADSIGVHRGTLRDWQYVVFEFPEPQQPPEAYLVALLVSGQYGRYFTLEKTISFGKKPGAVLGEWDAQSHHNYGGGHEPTVAAFVEAISRVI